MVQENGAQKVDRSLVAHIVQSYVVKNTVAVDQLASLITTVHQALSGLGTVPPLAAKALTPAVPIGARCSRIMSSVSNVGFAPKPCAAIFGCDTVSMLQRIGRAGNCRRIIR